MRNRRRPVLRPLAVRWGALLLLLFLGFHSAHGASPLADSHCACAHGPEVDCECPHHEGDAGDSALPACHRRAKAEQRAKADTAPAIRARCGSTAHALVLLVTVTLERRELPELERRPLPIPEQTPPSPLRIYHSPPSPPPRAQV